MRKALLAGLALGLIWPAGASAHTTITGCDQHRVCTPLSLPYQQWVDEAKVPTPSVIVLLKEAACPNDENALACTDYLTVWMTPQSPDTDWHVIRGAFLHELGHLYWRSPNEQLAQQYSLCATGNTVGAICRFIRRHPR